MSATKYDVQSNKYDTPIARLTRPTEQELASQKRHWFFDSPIWSHILEKLAGVMLVVMGICAIMWAMHMDGKQAARELNQEQFETSVGTLCRTLIETVDQQGTQIKQLEERLQKLETPTHTE